MSHVIYKFPTTLGLILSIILSVVSWDENFTAELEPFDRVLVLLLQRQRHNVMMNPWDLLFEIKAKKRNYQQKQEAE